MNNRESCASNSHFRFIGPRSRLAVIALFFNAVLAVAPDIRGQVSDPTLYNTLLSRCRAAAADACTPDAGGEKGPLCSQMARRCSNIVLAGATSTPNYYVLAVLYAPPGCNNTTNAAGVSLKCGQTSSVDYNDQSTVGSKVSISDSIKASVSIAVSGGISLPGFSSFTGTQSDQFSSTTTDTTTNTIAKGLSSDIIVPGQEDGVNHAFDQFEILLNPAIAVASGGGITDWKLGYQGATPTIIEVFVSELENPATMRTGVQSALSKAGLTANDYTKILTLDPFAGSTGLLDETTIDTSRYLKTLNFSYEPPLSATDCPGGTCNCNSLKKSISNSFGSDQTATQENLKSIGYSVSAKFSNAVPGAPPVPSSSFGIDDSSSISWTVSASSTNSQAMSSSAAATISCPSVGYQGPVFVDVYWDAYYGTFLFVPTSNIGTDALLFKGHINQKVPAVGPVISSNVGSRLPAAEWVELKYGSQVYRTVPDRNGDFQIYGKRIPNVSHASIRYPGQKRPATVQILSLENHPRHSPN